MAEFYKFEIANWNEGTADLTLEQEAAYLRVVNAIRLADQPITFNKFALCGMWRCNERKANRILDELIASGKLRIEGGKIINDKAVDDASMLSRLRSDRASAGHRGGVQSGKSRSKSLKNNDTGEAIASTREEENRIEKIKEDTSVSSMLPKQSKASRLSEDWFLPMEWGESALSKGLSRPEVESEAERFRNYWISKSGKDATKVNWQATWNNWILSYLESRPRHDQRKQPKLTDREQFDIAHAEYARRLSAGQINRGPDPSDPWAQG